MLSGVCFWYMVRVRVDISTALCLVLALLCKDILWDYHNIGLVANHWEETRGRKYIFIFSEIVLFATPDSLWMCNKMIATIPTS